MLTLFKYFESNFNNTKSNWLENVNIPKSFHINKNTTLSSNLNLRNQLIIGKVVVKHFTASYNTHAITYFSKYLN